MAVSHWVARRARISPDLERDLGVRMNTPDRWTSPWIQASVTVHPKQKKLPIDRKASLKLRCKVWRSTHKNRHIKIN
jgi:hypothetical protein